MVKYRLHALFLQCGVTGRVKKDLSTASHRNAVPERLTGYEAEQAQRLCRRLEVLEEQMLELNAVQKREYEEDKHIGLATKSVGIRLIIKQICICFRLLRFF